jgi:hypothetical protein
MNNTTSTTLSRNTQNAFTFILLTGLLAGTLDGLSACAWFMIKGGKDPGIIFRYIASAAIGPSARTGGVGTTLLGIFFHYFNAFAFTIFYFFLYSKLPLLAKNKIVSAVLYGIFVWVVMNLAVVPLSHIGKFPSKPGPAVIELLILIVMIGLPVAWRTDNYYSAKA